MNKKKIKKNHIAKFTKENDKKAHKISPGNQKVRNFNTVWVKP